VLGDGDTDAHLVPTAAHKLPAAVLTPPTAITTPETVLGGSLASAEIASESHEDQAATVEGDSGEVA
jgi:hypothetical protein